MSSVLEELRWKKYPIGSDGFICLVDAMGDDQAIVRAARISYGAGTKKLSDDRNLIRYLYRHGHTTPFEMTEFVFIIRMPMDSWRQMIRHRTACLSGNVPLHFDLPGGISRRGNQLYTITVGDVFERFQRANSKARVERMHLRSINEDTGEVLHTNITDVWMTGAKDVFEVELKNGTKCCMSEDHLCFTDRGWMQLKQILRHNDEVIRLASVGPGRDTGVVPKLNTPDPATEEWLPVVNWEDYYAVSNQGRVRRIVGGKGSRSFGRCKKITISCGRACVSLNRPGSQTVALVHRLMANAFLGKPASTDLEVCHNNGNGLDNRIENIRWDTAESNAADRIRDGATTALGCSFSTIKTVTPLGKQMTFDLEVSGPWHNFSAGGMVVHNSVNEYSTRYSEAIDSRATTEPDQWRLQSATNKQGSGGLVTEFPDYFKDAIIDEDGVQFTIDNGQTAGGYLSYKERQLHLKAGAVYDERLKFGVAREQARKDLPLSTYTEAYWKCDLKNIMNFLSLRMDSHAQLEIRLYANAMYDIVKQICPLAIEAFDEYDMRRGGLLLTATEVKMIKEITLCGYGTPPPISMAVFLDVCESVGWPREGRCRERDEAIAKFTRMNLINVENV